MDKGYRDRDTETWLNERGVTVVRPAYRTEPPRPGRGLLRAVRQSIESVNDTFKGQLDLEQHGGRTITGVAVRILRGRYGKGNPGVRQPGHRAGRRQPGTRSQLSAY